MAFNFPANPSDGDTYEGYVYDSIAGVWNAIPSTIESTGGGFVASATAPESPSEGDGWFDTNTAKSYIYYDGFWVQIGANGTLSLGDVGDVVITSPANGESLVFDGTGWVNQNVSVDVYDVSTTSVGKLALPSGTTAERPETPNAGDIRFNTDSGEPEWYSEEATDWVNFRNRAPLGVDIEYIVVAGGGGGGAGAGLGGGAGAGGYRSSVLGEQSGGGFSAEEIFLATSSVEYNITIGAGGAGGIVNDSAGGTAGSASAFHSILCTGGGGGGTALSNSSGAGNAGGSGGGGAENGATFGASGSATSGQGYPGGAADPNTDRAGGGGGAGGVGGSSSTSAGGAGIFSSITGSATGRAGGGGGSALAAPVGATSGGGTGRTSNSAGGNATANTGGGGGGAYATFNGGSGGSGIVILRYLSTVQPTFSLGLTVNTTTIGSYKVSQITAGTGTVTFS